MVLRFHTVSQMVEPSGVLLPSIDLSAAKYKCPNLWCHRITSSSLLLGVIESNVIYGHAALRRDAAHHAKHRNIRYIFDYLYTLY